MKYWQKSIKYSLSLLRKSNHILPGNGLDNLYKIMIRSLLDYCDIIYDSCTMHESEQLDQLQKNAILLMVPSESPAMKSKRIRIVKVDKSKNKSQACFFYKI